jgi:predicted HAD superfamily Cof-like phosphohydrolase
MSMSNVIEALREFRTAAGIPVEPVDEQHRLVILSSLSALIQEEVRELLEELEPITAERSDVRTLKELCDVLYVVLQVAVVLDLPIDEGFALVHQANMLKVTNPQFDENGKIMKSIEYVRAYDNLRSNLFKTIESHQQANL